MTPLPHPPMRQVKVDSRVFVEEPPIDALEGYYCITILAASGASAPLVVDLAFTGLPESATQMQRLFDGDYLINITNGHFIVHFIAH